MDGITAASVGDLATLIPSFERSLRAANKSPKTVQVYSEAANQLPAFLRETGMPTAVEQIRREGVESFIERLVQTRASPLSLTTGNPALTALFGFLVDFGEIIESPMRKMKPPKVPDVPCRWSPTISSADCSRPAKARSGMPGEISTMPPERARSWLSHHGARQRRDGDLLPTKGSGMDLGGTPRSPAHRVLCEARRFSNGTRRRGGRTSDNSGRQQLVTLSGDQRSTAGGMWASP